MRTMLASEFKARCLRVMDDVQRKGQAVVITKRGRAVVKVIPVSQAAVSPFGCLKGKFELVGDLVGPVFPDWR